MIRDLFTKNQVIDIHEDYRLISQKIKDSKPFNVCRIGGIEASAAYRFVSRRHIRTKSLRSLQTNAGFFFNSRKQLTRFNFLNIQALCRSSVIAEWKSSNQAKLLTYIGCDQPRVSLRSLEPFWTEDTWLRKSIGTICIVSPFTSSIITQLEYIDNIHPGLGFSHLDFQTCPAPMTTALRYLRLVLIGSLTWKNY